ncbi:hypothetical protein [Nocardia crassostreae]|uniref:hypothetical protein n=1 Tax=Nocardia crassostreae TaxID=53428 RepID=UPI000A4ACF9A|nr:hypothetical protein [Nocardia crassostreae]
MSDASSKVLLDDFENKDNWEVAGAGADRTHLTTFAEGAPGKELAAFASGETGRDHRALVLLIRQASDDLEVELVAKSGETFSIAGQLAALNLWVRSPHASIRVYARLGNTAEEHELLIGKVTVGGDWQHVEHAVGEDIKDARLLGLKTRLVDVVKTQGEVMILLDDLTARTK